MRFRLPQRCVYWAATGADGFGRPVVADPVELPCRWEDRTRKTIGPTGDEVLSSATVYLASAVAVGGFLYKGPITDTEESGWQTILKNNRGVKEIITAGTIPSLKGSQSLSEAQLV